MSRPDPGPFVGLSLPTYIRGNPSACRPNERLE
jgi:hypothetical protein